jgi:LysR family glycine cleavage system transcriptional activator
MHHLRRMIPSANSLFVFEAAARLESFKGAAQELNVTQPAITYSIRQLEQALGIKLFHRRHRGVELTGDGKALYRDVRSGLDTIYRSAFALQAATSDEKVELSISTSMASFWLLPRLSDFRRNHPEAEIRFHAVDQDINPGRENVDLTVLLGDGHWPEFDSWRFIDEETFPVCNPAYLESAPPLTDVADLARHKLLHLQEPYRVRMGWNAWLQALGSSLHIDHGDTFTDAQMLYQATVEGQGICLGWAGLLDIPLKQGLLTRPLDISVRTGQSFYIIAARGEPLSLHARALRDWMLEQGKANRRG